MVGATSVRWTTLRGHDGLARGLRGGQQLRMQSGTQKSGARLIVGALTRQLNIGGTAKWQAGVIGLPCRTLKPAQRSRHHLNISLAPSSVQLPSGFLGRPLSTHDVNLRKCRAGCHGAPNVVEREEQAPSVEGLVDAPTPLEDRVMRQTFTTRWYEVGANGKARMETIANYMQETGANHVNSVYASSDGLPSSPLMKKHHLVWIIVKMHTEVDSYPSWGDDVRVESWTEPVGRNGGRRDWSIVNSRSGVEMGRGTSLWVMMNLDTRRLARIPDDVRNEYASFCPEEPRFAIPDMAVVNQRLPQGEGAPTRTAKDLQARYGDLDMNRHINNVTYTSWFLEAVDPSLWETHVLSALTIEFRQECTGEDLVESTLHAEDAPAVENGHGEPVAGELTFLHSLCLQTSRKELARARTQWRVKEDCEKAQALQQIIA